MKQTIQDMALGGSLRDVLAEVGWTVGRLAKVANVKPAEVKAWLRGRPIPPAILACLAGYLAGQRSSPIKVDASTVTAATRVPGVFIT